MRRRTWVERLLQCASAHDGRSHSGERADVDRHGDMHLPLRPVADSATSGWRRRADRHECRRTHLRRAVRRQPVVQPRRSRCDLSRSRRLREPYAGPSRRSARCLAVPGSHRRDGSLALPRLASVERVRPAGSAPRRISAPQRARGAAQTRTPCASSSGAIHWPGFPYGAVGEESRRHLGRWSDRYREKHWSGRQGLPLRGAHDPRRQRRRRPLWRDVDTNTERVRRRDDEVPLRARLPVDLRHARLQIVLKECRKPLQRLADLLDPRCLHLALPLGEYRAASPIVLISAVTRAWRSAMALSRRIP